MVYVSGFDGKKSVKTEKNWRRILGIVWISYGGEA